MSVASNAWARRHHAELLARLEAEERAGWPDLPWPPVMPAPAADERLVALLERVLIHLRAAVWADERDRVAAATVLHRVAALDQWRRAGLPKRAA